MNISAGLEAYMKELARFGNDEPEIAKKVVVAGAQPVADAIRNRLENLPEDQFRRLKEGDVFNGLPQGEWKDLMDNMGIAPPKVDGDGNTNTKVGFKGYGSFPTKKYPKGVPNAMLARAIESGSSVRKKTPFVRPAVNKSKALAIEEMEKAINNEIKIYAL
jgi:hypothetical protein